MTVDMIAVFILTVAAVLLFVTEKLPPDLTSVLIMAALLLSGIVTPAEGIAGFSNTATVTVAAVFILSAGLLRTGAVNFVGTLLARIGRRSFWLALLSMMLVIGAISGFINNTAAVAIFLPIVIGTARDLKVSASRLLMPLSFASMFGGVCTLIGTSTNLLASTIAERHGLHPIGMFEMSGMGLVFFAAGILYMMLVGVRLLPERAAEEDIRKRFGLDDYLTEIVLQPEAKSVGTILAGSPLLRDVEIGSVEVYRHGHRLFTPHDRLVLQAGDMLRVRCDLENFAKLQQRRGITLKSELEQGRTTEKPEGTLLVEAVVAPRSTLDGHSLKQARLRSRYGLTAHAVRHRGHVTRDHLEELTLRAGDVLLIEADARTIDRLGEDQTFVMLAPVEVPLVRKRKMLVALAIFGAAVVAAAMGVVPIVSGAVAGCVLLVLTRCLTLEEAYRAIDWTVIFLMAGMMTLGTALENTGGARLLARGVAAVAGEWGPVAMLAAFYLLTAILTASMSNSATVALLIPIAVAASHGYGIDPRPLLMTVTFAASLDFMTPFGYQTNTLIYGPGRYRFVDYLRVGGPLNFLFWTLATLLIPRFWPFHP